MPRRPVVLVALLAAGRVAAAEPAPQEPALVLELPALDAPAAADLGGRFPTWQQSSALAIDVVLAGHWALDRASRPLGWARIPVALVGAFLLDVQVLELVPGGVAWAHEEGHRAVMAARGIDSVDELNHPLREPVGDDGHKRVYGMTDAELASMKAEDPAGFVRLHAAGLETQIDVGREVEKRVFFARDPAYPYVPFHLWNHLRAALYLHECTDVSPEDLDVEAGLPETRRDFTGPDCTAWAYDLDRPDEPYADRGMYPDGTIRRARATSDLSGRALDFLRLNRSLALLNFADPMAFGLAAFPARAAGREVRWNARLEHQLTSFGGRVAIDALAQRGALNLFGALHGYFNDRTLLPGITAGLVRYPLPWRDGRPLLVTSEATLWLQPRHQRLDDEAAAPGAQIRIGAATRLFGPVELAAAVRAKTAGWASGQTPLGPAADLWLGLDLLLP